MELFFGNAWAELIETWISGSVNMDKRMIHVKLQCKPFVNNGVIFFL